MQVILIGSGNVAALLGRLFIKNNHQVCQVYSRTAANAMQLATELNAEPISDLRQINTHADLYVIAVSDQAVEEVANQFTTADQLVIHTAGSVAKEVLKNTSNTYGVLWPIKMIRATANSIAPATIVVDGNTEEVKERIKEIARLFSGAIVEADDTTRIKMHMMAVLTTNFSNHLFQLADEYCSSEGIAFSHFYPLIEAAVQEIKNHHPRSLQAGPAFRGDGATIEKHQQLLASYPQILEVYRTMTASIGKSFRGSE